MPTLWFGYFNWFSGQSLFENTGMTLFNMIYTSAPIIFYSLFDRETTDTVLLKESSLLRHRQTRLSIEHLAIRTMVPVGCRARHHHIFHGVSYLSSSTYMLDYKAAQKDGYSFGFSPQAKSSSLSWSLPRT